MGTTRQAIRTQTGVELAYVLVIEGYKYLLTDGLPSKAVAAWAGTSWSLARAGLQVSGGMSQKLEPWSNELPQSGMTFKIFGEEFAVDMFKAKPSVRSELTLAFDTSTSGPGGFNITVKDASLFAAGTPVMIGNETFNVTGTPSGTTIPVALGGSGYFHPFAADGKTNSFPGEHSIAPNVSVGNYEVNAPTWVSDSPATWIGKKVALHVHRVTAGVWDLKAQSEVWFAGTIDEIDTVGPLATRIQCSGMTQAIADATLMYNQWSAKVEEGYIFNDGDSIRAVYQQIDGSTTVAFADSLKASGYITAATPGTGTGEFPSGRYTVEEFGSVLAKRLDEDATIGVSGTGFTLRWSAYTFSGPTGTRFEVVATESYAVVGKVVLGFSDKGIATWLGYDITVADEFYAARVDGPESDFTQRVRVTSQHAPYRYATFGFRGDRDHRSITLQVSDSDGEFFDHTSLLPPAAQELVGPGETWSFYSLGDRIIFLGRKDSDSQISAIDMSTPLSMIAQDPENLEAVLRIETGQALRVKQIFYACDSLQGLMSKLFASTDGKGTNHAEYDVFPFGAGIPWSLLGDPFVESLKALEQSGVEDSIALIVEKPIPMWDAIKSDFALRMAGPVWKDGGLVVAQFTVPNASTAEHILDETNKSDTLDTKTATVRDYLAHTLKVLFNRNPLTDKYDDHFIVRDVSAYRAAGGAGVTKTIKARNSYSGVAASGASAQALADMIASRFLPVLARPLKRFNRSISHNHFHAAPGDIASVSDDRVRDPETGALGITSRATTVTSVSYSLGISSGGQGYHGDVDLLFTEEDRLFPLAPSAEHATVTSGAYTAGWNSAGKSLLLNKHSFSRTTASTDAQSFASGDAVRVTEQDPADPTAADSFADTLSAAPTLEAVTGYDAFTFTNGFGVGGRPAFDATKTYLVNYDTYSSCQAGQVLKAFQADDIGGMIETNTEPNLVADGVKTGTSVAADTTLLPSRYSTQEYGDGVPVSASFLRNIGRMANNLVNYKTAPHSPYVTQTEAIQLTGSADIYFTIWTIPFFLSNDQWPAGRVRKLNVAPLFRSDGLVTSTIRVTSAQNPPKGTSYVDTSWFGPKKQVSFTASTSTMSIATAQELDIVRDQDRPYITWITVEGNDKAGFKGLAELRLGPLQNG